MEIHRDSNVGDIKGLRANLTNDQDQLQAFDELPKELRDLIRDLPFRVSCIEILRNHYVGVSIQRQIKGLRAFANECGWTVWSNHFGKDVANDLWDRLHLTKPSV